MVLFGCSSFWTNLAYPSIQIFSTSSWNEYKSLIYKYFYIKIIKELNNYVTSLFLTKTTKPIITLVENFQFSPWFQHWSSSSYSIKSPVTFALKKKINIK